MKIHDIGGQNGPNRPEGLSDDRAKTARSAEVGRTEGDRVELSRSARRLATLVEAANRLPSTRQERVEQLRGLIDKGSYPVDPHVLARAILEFEDGLFR